MKVDYVDHMGSDLTVVNAARVSFDKHKEQLDTSDIKLLSYLAKHNHWSPYAHPQITLRVKAPIFIRTQCFKHAVGFVANEVSRRYVDDEPEFFVPDVWRGKPTESAKQGSDGVVEDVKWCKNIYQSSIYNSTLMYQGLLAAGVAPEQARMVLPQSMLTSWYWTGSLAAYARFCKLRLDPHAQQEIQDLARMVSDIIEPLYPYSWGALHDG